MKFAEIYLPDTTFGFEYSPEIFMDTELDFSLEICEAVMDAWQPDADREIVLNLPCTVERSTPNVYADQIEYMSRNLTRREHICLSVHTHNDRGTATADAELAVLAGAQRVEGCLFGNGERSGNVDLVTLGLNLYSQGIDPMIDFSDIDEIRRTAEYCNRIDVHERHPYAGDLVYTSFSGSHQDAIKKGFEDLERSRRRGRQAGRRDAVGHPVPADRPEGRRPLLRGRDPGELAVGQGRRRLHHEGRPQARPAAPAADRVQPRHPAAHRRRGRRGRRRRRCGTSSPPSTSRPGACRAREARLDQRRGHRADHRDRSALNGVEHEITGVGNGPIAAFCDALSSVDLGFGGISVRVLDYNEHALTSGRDAEAAAYLEIEIGDQVLWGVGISESTTQASLRAVISGVNRVIKSLA